MSCAIVVHGAIGSGKTNTCLRLAERANREEAAVGGIITLRQFQRGELMGYDCQEVASGRTFPLARLRENVEGPDWFEFGGLKYAFSLQGFERANEILARSVQDLSRNAIVFVDEFGRLERAGLGLYEGAKKVAEGLRDGGIAVFSCRTDTVEFVEGLVHNHAQAVLRFEPGDEKLLWLTVKKRTRARHPEPFTMNRNRTPARREMQTRGVRGSHQAV